METKNILIKDAIILKQENINGKIIQSGKKESLLIENDKIAEISPKIDSIAIDKIIDGTNKILMPGLVNTHTHISMNLFRGLTDDMELDTWLNDHIWPMEAKLNGDYCYIGALLAQVEMIKSGTTTFNDMYFFMEDVAKSVEKSGIRGCLSYGMIDFGDLKKRENEFRENIRLIKKCNNQANGRIKTFFGPHSTFTCSKELLDGVREKANKYNVGIHIHMNETQKEIKDLMEATGKRPFEYLNDINFLNGDVLAAHGVWLSKEEIKIIKENNVKISHNPCSNMKLSSGISPVAELLANKICVSIGTDGAASNNNLDMFEEMKFASLLQKVSTTNPKALPANDVINMATLNGAKSLGLESDIGSLEVGKYADMILVDINSPNLTPMSNQISSNLVYAANGSNVSHTICNGEILMENRNLTKLDEDEILKRARIAIEELKTI
ncbi:MAG: amidohydrolase family protein [Methanobacteriaceae archaeon]|nr:amidohydrolase family protein [Candidatus Methanorudis spinitermitis]